MKLKSCYRLLVLIVLTCFGCGVYNCHGSQMIPCNPKVLKCPHCGEFKTVDAIISGNTIGKVVWSDMKSYCPMLPRPSYVQRCPSCRKYFFNDKSVQAGYAESECSSSLGELSYLSLKEAFNQLAPAGENEEIMRMMLLWAYNDIYGGCKRVSDCKDVPAEEREYFVNNVNALIAICQNNDEHLFVAELYREIGEFDKCIAELKAIKDEEGKEVREMIMTMALNRNADVFILPWCEQTMERISVIEKQEYPYKGKIDTNFR